jgi:hypothetical protein
MQEHKHYSKGIDYNCMKYTFPQLLILKYKAITDAKRELGAISDIRDTFIGFQEYLYEW